MRAPRRASALLLLLLASDKSGDKNRPRPHHPKTPVPIRPLVPPLPVDHSAAVAFRFFSLRAAVRAGPEAVAAAAQVNARGAEESARAR